MLYRLEYKFGGRAYVIEDDVRGIAEPSQYEAVADGLALTASEIYHHASSGEYKKMCLYEDGRMIWFDGCRIISK